MALGVGIVVCLFIIEATKGKRGEPEPVSSKENPSMLDRMSSEYQEYSISPVETSVTQTRIQARASAATRDAAKKQSDESQALLEENLAKTAELSELQGKYNRLEQLFKEKSSEFDKMWKELENETKNRKEFNKVKDLLEKEIKDLRDKNHKQQLELTASQAETENVKKRSLQLDEKISLRDKEIREKEKQIDELVKRMQTFAAKPPEPPPPSTQNTAAPALTPPEPPLTS